MVKYRYAVTIHIDGTDHGGTVEEVKAQMPVLTDTITKLMLKVAAGTDATVKVTQTHGEAYEAGD